MAEIGSEQQIKPQDETIESELHFSEKTKPVVDVLTGPIRNLPLDTDGFVEKIGEKNAINLVSELIEQKAFRTRLFANALALVSFDKLPDKTKEWFRKEGLVILERENIRVNLKHQNETKARTCQEVGQYIVDGEPRAQRFDLSKKPDHVSLSAFTSHGITEQSPNGALAEVNIWDKKSPILQYTIAGCYVTGTGPNARGIMVPAVERNIDKRQGLIVYMHTKGSFEKRRRERNFYVRQEWGDVDKTAEYGFEALGLYLVGEISLSKKDRE